MSGLPNYQGRADSEVFALAVDKALKTMSFKGTVPDADTFSRSVGDVYQQFAGVTNLGRTLYWMVGRQTGETTESMIKAGGFDYTSDSIIDAAEGFGIQTKSFDHHSYRWGYSEVS